jgi:CRP-like cAMP-binding protein
MEPKRPSMEILRRAAIFDALSDADRQSLLVCVRSRAYRAGEPVFREGDPAGFMVIVTEGTFAASVRGAGGQAREIGRMGPGEILGPMASADPAPRECTVTTLSEGAGLELGADELEILRRNAPSAARALITAALRSAAGRLRRLEERIEVELRR